MSKENQERDLIKRGRYALTNPDTGKPATYQRVTTFNKILSDESGLIDWTARLVAKGVADNDHLVVRASDASVDDRGELNRIAKEAKKLAGGDEAADNGIVIHHLTEGVDRGENPRIPPKWKGHIERYQRMVSEGPLEILPEWIERVVCVPELGVAGTFDRLMRVKKDMIVAFPSGKEVHLKRGEFVVVDVKSSKTLDYSQIPFAVQFACYSRARHAWVVEDETWEPLPEVNQHVAFVYWIPSTKTEAGIVAVDIDEGWNLALECKKIREKRNNKKMIQSVYSIAAEAAPEDPDTFTYRVKNASSKQELSAIWKEAVSVGMWDAKLEALGKIRLGQL